MMASRGTTNINPWTSLQQVSRDQEGPPQAEESHAQHAEVPEESREGEGVSSNSPFGRRGNSNSGYGLWHGERENGLRQASEKERREAISGIRKTIHYGNLYLLWILGLL